MRLVLRWFAIFSPRQRPFGLCAVPTEPVGVDVHRMRSGDAGLDLEPWTLDLEPAERARLAGVAEADSAQNVYRANALGFHELERDDDFSDYAELTGREVKR